MTINVINQDPYLRSSREFPQEIPRLVQEVNKSYLEIATAVNTRTIGLFPVNRAANNGEEWFLTGNQKQQGFRLVFNFAALTAGVTTTIAHGLNFNSISTFTTIKGIAFCQSTNQYLPLPFVSNLAANQQIALVVDQTNINILPGVGLPFAVSKGIILLEWISNP